MEEIKVVQMAVEMYKPTGSAANHCRQCTGLMVQEDGDATICFPCMMNITRGKIMKKRKDSKCAIQN